MASQYTTRIEFELLRLSTVEDVVHVLCPTPRMQGQVSRELWEAMIGTRWHILDEQQWNACDETILLQSPEDGPVAIVSEYSSMCFVYQRAILQGICVKSVIASTVAVLIDYNPLEDGIMCHICDDDGSVKSSMSIGEFLKLYKSTERLYC